MTSHCAMVWASAVEWSFSTIASVRSIPAVTPADDQTSGCGPGDVERLHPRKGDDDDSMHGAMTDGRRHGVNDPMPTIAAIAPAEFDRVLVLVRSELPMYETASATQKSSSKPTSPDTPT